MTDGYDVDLKTSREPWIQDPWAGAFPQFDKGLEKTMDRGGFVEMKLGQP
jgi:hypothetical protein